MEDFLAHHGVKGMRWGQHIMAGKNLAKEVASKDVREDKDVLFVSGSSKTQDKNSEYYRKDLPKDVQKELKTSMKRGDKIIVGDAPGIDRQVQDYLKRKHYKDVEVYGPGKQVRYSANKKWKTNPIDAPEYEPMSKEWLAKKDIVMTNNATKGLAVVLDEGSSATRRNVQRLIDQNKDVKVYSINRDRKDGWVV